MGLKWQLGIILLTVLLSFSPVMADSPTVSGISEELVCQCGCNMGLLNCTHAECGSRGAMTTLIKQKLAQGQSGEQIIQIFVAQYGEQVLASPPKKGFNLTAWILPFAAILVGGGIIAFTLKNWVGRGRKSQTIPVSEEGDEEYQCQLEKELEDFTERGFR